MAAHHPAGTAQLSAVVAAHRILELGIEAVDAEAIAAAAGLSPQAASLVVAHREGFGLFHRLDDALRAGRADALVAQHVGI